MQKKRKVKLTVIPVEWFKMNYDMSMALYTVQTTLSFK